MATDGYMNLQLASTEEYMDGNCTGNLVGVGVVYIVTIEAIGYGLLKNFGPMVI